MNSNLININKLLPRKVFKFFPTRMLKNHCSKPRHPVSNFLTGFDANCGLGVEARFLGDRTEWDSFFVSV